MNILPYTFRTFPWQDNLKLIFPNLFIFNSLKKSILEFEEIVVNTKPDLVLGIAKSDNKSYWESITINQFNKTKKVIKDSDADSYELFLPDLPQFRIKKIFTDSFCNWTAFRLADFILQNNVSTKLSFTHICASDIVNLKTLTQLKLN